MPEVVKPSGDVSPGGRPEAPATVPVGPVSPGPAQAPPHSAASSRPSRRQVAASMRFLTRGGGRCDRGSTSASATGGMPAAPAAPATATAEAAPAAHASCCGSGGAAAPAAGGAPAAPWPKSDFPAVPPLFASNYFRLSHVFFRKFSGKNSIFPPFSGCKYNGKRDDVDATGPAGTGGSAASEPRGCTQCCRCRK